MKKFTFFLLLLAMCCLSVQSYSQKGSIDKANPPNIILIMADDMGYSDLGCFGGEVKTPNIDGLANKGIRFTHMYTNAWCSPSRASLLTGLYPQQVGMGLLAEAQPGPEGPYQGYLSRNCVTLAEVLKSAGYSTAISGKWHLGDSSIYWPINRGFEHAFGLISGAANYFDITKTKSHSVKRKMAFDNQLFTPPKHGFYMTNAITDDAVGVLDKTKGNSSPFFLYVAYTAPHWPLQALQKEIDKYKGKYSIGWDSLRTLRFERQKQLGIVPKSAHLSSRDAKVHAWTSLSENEKKVMEQKMEIYAAQIDIMDQGVGKILQKLKELHKEKNTIVIFLSDNGGCAEGGLSGFDKRHNGLPPGGVNSYMSYGQSWANASNTPFRYYKTTLFEGGLADPMIIRWPAVINKSRQGTIITQVAHLIDIMPTICHITGAKYPDKFKDKKILSMEGQSFARQIEGFPNQPHKPLYWSLKEHKAILVGNYKLEATSNHSPWTLFNIKNDRIESNNLANKKPEKIKRMKALWEAWAKRVRVFD